MLLVEASEARGTYSPDSRGVAAGSAEAGMSVFANESARPVGKVAVVAGAAGLAVIRLEAAFGPKASPLHVGQKDGPLLRAQRPAWWPQEWGQEQGSQQ